ncbi:MAG: RIP metalloprotease RseP [Bacteroidetes bacterium]|nr:RIP metalloprotease RseP [Bacteroidota bacterium]
MDILIKILQLLLSLSILVIFHEFGHFITAKLFKTRVEKFYLFFNPWFSLFKFKKGETEYGMGWLPLGGYVKISGMIDESMDKEQMKLPPQPHEFRSKPTWQRLIIMLGGVTVNILLAIAIYIVMLAYWGDEYLPTSEVNKYGITCDSLALEMGLMNGDKFLSVDNEVVEDYAKIPLILILDEAQSVQVERDGEIKDIPIPKGFIGKLIKQKKPNFLSVRFPYEVEKFGKNSPAEAAGMLVDDKILGINELSLQYYDEFQSQLKNYINQTIVVPVLRDNDTVRLNIDVSEEGILGVYPKSPMHYFTSAERDYSFAEAIPAGFVKAYDGIGNYLKQLRLLFSPEVQAYKSVGGFITIGSIFPSTWDWENFWRLTAFLSIMLAILNVLPIPALDGGHVMFLMYEIITRKKASDKFMEYAQLVGMIILFGLLIFANGNDIVKLFN